MRVHVTCTCGKQLSTDDRFAGRPTTCPACGAAVTIPQPTQPAHPEAAPNPPAAAPAETPQPAPAPGGPLSEEQLLATLRAFVPHDAVFVTPDIPPNKETNARAACHIAPAERIFGIVDCTCLGSAKNGLVFTSEAICFHNDWTTEIRQGRVAYTDFKDRPFHVGKRKSLQLGNGLVLDMSGSSADPNHVIRMLRAVGACTHGTAPASVAPLPPGPVQ